MSDVKTVMRNMRITVADTRDEAKRALEDYAEQMADDARERAPVRKMYATPKGKRESTREVSAAFLELMREYAERTSYTDKNGQTQRGYLSPNFAIKNRYRRINPKNHPNSPARVLGTVQIKTKKVPRGAEVKSMFGKLYWRGSLKGNRKVAHVTQEKWARVHTAKFTPTKGLDINVELVETRRGGTVLGGGERATSWKISKVTASPELLAQMNAKQRYMLRHGIGMRIVETGREGGHARIVMGGTLRDSIMAKRVGELKYEVAAHVDYAKYVEFGTRYMEAQPFLVPVFLFARRDMASAIAKRMKG